jgi:hypothetical protein
VNVELSGKDQAGLTFEQFVGGALAQNGG